MLISIESDGTLQALYDDDLENVFRVVGPLNVRRLSIVEFDNESQAWEVILPNRLGNKGDLITTEFSTRAKALQWEREYFECKMENGERITT